MVSSPTALSRALALISACVCLFDSLSQHAVSAVALKVPQSVSRVPMIDQDATKHEINQAVVNSLAADDEFRQ